MPNFSQTSKSRLATCDVRLQRVFEKVVETVDCSVLEGHRGEARQNQLFDEGKSKVRFPDGKHNATPSKAVDVVPYPVDWEDRDRFMMFGGYVLGVAESMGVQLRWGGDWATWNPKDNTFVDCPHFEVA